MARELEILEKLKSGDLPDEADKKEIYSAHTFLLTAELGQETTLMHEIVLLPNMLQILQTLDLNFAEAAGVFESYSSSYGTFSPLGTFIYHVAETTISGQFMTDYYKDICLLVRHSSKVDVQLRKESLKPDYCREDILELIEECEAEIAYESTSVAASAEGHHESTTHSDTVSSLAGASVSDSPVADGLL